MRFSERGGWWVLAQAVVLAAAAGLLLAWGDGWPTAVRLAGWALAGAGGVLAGWGLLALGPNLSPYPHPVEDGGLVEHGPYRLVRHPVYGGLILGTGGLGIGDGNPLVIALALVLAGIFAGKSSVEESRFEARHPGYGGYRERVRRRMIPWLW